MVTGTAEHCADYIAKKKFAGRKAGISQGSAYYRDAGPWVHDRSDQKDTVAKVPPVRLSLDELTCPPPRLSDWIRQTCMQRATDRKVALPSGIEKGGKKAKQPETYQEKVGGEEPA